MTASRLPNSAAANALHVLQRETFQTSRLLDFCSERELVNRSATALTCGLWSFSRS